MSAREQASSAPVGCVGTNTTVDTEGRKAVTGKIEADGGGSREGWAWESGRDGCHADDLGASPARGWGEGRCQWVQVNAGAGAQLARGGELGWDEEGERGDGCENILWFIRVPDAVHMRF